jgi:hypothetical protein
MQASCGLDVADEGAQTFPAIGRMLNLSEAGADWAFRQALAELQTKLDAAGLDLRAEDALRLLAEASRRETTPPPASRAA